MPDLLLELRSEEIPARMQRKAAGDLRKLVTDGLVDAGLTYEGAQEHWTPRRLVLDLRGVTARSKDVREERKGPRTDAPEKAIEGFLRSAGLSSVDEATVRTDPKKGEFYVATIEKPGRSAEEIVADIMPGIIRGFPWPKSMRWGAASAKPGSLRWVRPLQGILCTFGPETEDPVVVDFEVDGIRAGNVTRGHRFHAPEEITVRRFDDYVAKLEAAKVVVDAERRKRIILDDARNLAFAGGLDLVEDEGLLEEVSGLVEWPVVLLGEFEEDYLQIPPEVVRLTIRENQKCFVTRPFSPLAGEMSAKQTEGGTPDDVAPSSMGQTLLSNRFVVTANIEAKDGGVEIARGNAKVVRARLSDALYFWKTDQADLPDRDRLAASAEKFGLDLTKPLDQRMARLDHLGVTFHAKLGTQGERVERIRRLAGELAPLVARSFAAQGQGPSAGQAAPAEAAAKQLSAVSEKELAKLAERAAVLCKADLQTEIVGEFPELQGAMGTKYAALQGEDPAVAAAIEAHYRPLGPTDTVPSDPVAVAVALADKLDMLVGFWAIDEKPTGSKDPYALRRAALGVIRIVVENGVRLGLSTMYAHQLREFLRRGASGLKEGPRGTTPESGYDDILEEFGGRSDVPPTKWEIEVGTDLLSFFHDRLKVYLRDKGARHDLIDAVLASGDRPQAEASTEARRSSGAPAEASAQQTAASAGNDDLLLIVKRVAALGDLLDTEDGRNLVAGTKRAANILAAEEKKGTRVAGTVDPALLTEKTELELYDAVNQAERQAGEAIEKQDYSAAMRALAALRAPVDSFFEDVLVNAEDEAVRANRLALLARIRTATGQVADFSKIAG